MARTLELVKREDFVADISTLDLTGYNDGFELSDRGWKQLIGDVSGQAVDEALALMIESTDEDDLASVVQGLKDYKDLVDWYSGGSDKYGCWLRSQLRNESNARQAFLSRLRYDPPPWHTFYNTHLDNFVLGITRSPWEDTAYTTYNGNAVSSVGGTFTVSSNAGDLPSRLARVDMAETGGALMYQYWLGFRGPRLGTPANFQPYWSLRKGISARYDADTTGGTTNADATAKDGYKTITTFSADASMIRRAFVQCYDVAANPNDQRGRYQLLLRAKLSAGSTTVRVRRLSCAYGDYLTPAFGARVEITGTDWYFYDLGPITFPSHRMIGGYDYLDHNQIGIAAERVSGAGNLEMDCFVLIPISEGYVFATIPATDNLKVSVMQHADGSHQAYTTSVNTPFASAQAQVSGGLPIGSGIGVVAAQRLAESDLTDTVEADLYVYNRWSALRGSDT